MPPRRINPPPEVMTWGKSSAILAVSVSAIFDTLRIACGFLWLFGPALAGIYCQQKLGGALGETIATAVCATGATTLGVTASPVFMLFGTVLAIAMGIFGWLIVIAIIIFTNERLMKENFSHVFWLAGSLLVSEIPIIGSIPALTATVIKLYSDQIKRDKEMLQTYEADIVAAKQEERDQHTALLFQMQNARTQEAQEAAYEKQAEKEAEEIPDEMRMAA
ncbi:MAG: hypothetical protein Q7J45_01900 [bacterium]|nr:hypothetical protein [bacterium]